MAIIVGRTGSHAASVGNRIECQWYAKTKTDTKFTRKINIGFRGVFRTLSNI